MFHTDTIKDDEDKESSENLSDEVDEILREPIVELAPSTAEPVDIHDFGDNFK